jgi:hypothetical protein
MGSVMTTSNRPNSRKIFSPLVLSRIAERVDQGFSAAEIADEIGCKLGSLRVRCSEHGISLKRAARYASDRRERRERMVINISKSTALALQRQAGNEQMSAAQFAAVLLEAVVRDDLYEAVIDCDRIEPAAELRDGSIFTHVSNHPSLHTSAIKWPRRVAPKIATRKDDELSSHLHGRSAHGFLFSRRGSNSEHDIAPKSRCWTTQNAPAPRTATPRHPAK